MTDKEEKPNPYKRELTPRDKANIQKLMEMNPILDYFMAETIILTPEEELQDTINKVKDGTLEDPLPNKEYESHVIKTGFVIDPENEEDKELLNKV